MPSFHTLNRLAQHVLFTLVLSFGSASVGKAGLVPNGDFEAAGADGGWPANWVFADTKAAA